MGIVLEYVLDAYQWTDRYALSNADTQWNRKKSRIRCGTNYLIKVGWMGSRSDSGSTGNTAAVPPRCD
jgi:hypothetical protein